MQEEVPKKSRFKKVLFIAFLTLSVLTAAGLVLSMVYSDVLKKAVVDALNRRLKAKVAVASIDFTVFSTFPNASVRFTEVSIANPPEFRTSGTVFKAGNVFFTFSLKDLLTNTVRLQGVEVINASVNLQTNRLGQTNYDIWKKDTTSTTEGSMKVDLNAIRFVNTEWTYIDRQKNQDVEFHLADAVFSGALSADRFEMTLKAGLEQTTVVLDKISYLSKKDCNIDARIAVNMLDGSFSVANGKMKLEGMEFDLDGDILDHKEGKYFNLTFAAPKADIAALLSLLPKEYVSRFAEFNCTGTISLKGAVKGFSNENSTPVFNLDFVSTNAGISPEGTDYHISNINGNGHFTNRISNSNQVAGLMLNRITAKFQGKPFSLDLNLEDFNNPHLDLRLSADADLEVLSTFYKPDTIESLTGAIQADIDFNGIAREKSTYRSSGTVRFTNAGFVFKGGQQGITNLNGLLHLRGNDMVLEGLSGKAGKTDFNVTGSFSNLMAFLLLDDQALDIQATFKSNVMDLDELLALGSSESSSDSSIHLSDLHKFDLDLDVGSLNFRKFSATAIKGTVSLNDAVLTTRELNLKTCGGDVQLRGTIDDRPADSIRISYDARVRNLDIRELFSEMGNFGQNTLIDKNLKGRVSAQVQFNSAWSQSLELNDKSIVAKSDISIENGELINFEPMQALSKFLKGSDLGTIRFSTMTNSIEIRDRKIYIPVMDIHSSALDLTASGVHDFDNMVDYHLGLYLSQLLGKKIRQQNTEFGNIEDDGLGRPKIYLSMKGPVSDPKFSWDRKGVEQKITDQIRNERKNLKELLKKEFGSNKQDDVNTIVPTPGKKSGNELQLDEDE